MNLVRLSLRRPFSILVLVTAIAAAAMLGLQQMPRDIFPNLGVPTIYVAQPYGGMDPAQMEGYLTYYYEYHFLYITGIEHVESKSIQGASIMKLQFHPGTDMSQALSETIGYVNRARAFMPPGTVPPFVTRFDAGSVPVGYLVFSTTNETRTVGQMQDAALNLVRPLFATLPGVSAPPPFGGSARTIVVNLKPARLRGLGMSPEDIVRAVSQANLISPSGNLNLGDKYPIVPVNAVVKNIKDLEALPLRVSSSGAVYLRDVASVQDGSDIVTSYALVNGRRTVYLPVTKRADASTLSVVELVRKNLPRFQSVLPTDINVGYEFDQSPVVRQSIRDLVKEAALGALLTGVMVLLFLRDLRSTLVVLINIPLSLLAATLGLWVTGQTINLMTLGGLTLAVGILVDEATVAVENIHARLSTGQSLARAALDGISETALPRFLAMLCVLAVFIPALFMRGAARALFAPLALAVGFSMAASFILSSTLVPVLSIWFLRAHGAHLKDPRFFARLQQAYVKVVARLIAWRWLVLGVYLVACAAILLLLGPKLGTEIFPQIDAGQLALRLRLPTGTRVENTERTALQVLKIIENEAGPGNVALTMGLAGVHGPNYPVNLIHLWNGGPEEAWLAIQFKPDSGLNLEQLRERLRRRLQREFPDVRLAFEPSDIVSRVMSFGSPQPIELAVQGPDLQASKEFALRLLDHLKPIPFVRDLGLAQSLDFPTVQVNVNRERAGLLGIQMGDVTRSLVAATTSSRFTVPNYWSDPKSGVSYNLQIQVPQSETASLEDLGNVPITGSGGRESLLRNIASINPGTAVGQYERYNMSRLVSLTANLHGTDLGTALRAIKRAVVAAGTPPPKTTVNLRGQAIPLEELLGGFRSGLLVAVVAVLLFLTANFQSLRLALVVLAVVPAAIAGVVVMLAITGTTLNIQSAMGAIMAVGVAMANAILLTSFAERFRNQNPRGLAEAALNGAQSRLRPILMTSVAMISGMLPMALGFGEGGPQSASLGRAVIGGLLGATLTTLFLVPSAFAVIAPRKHTSVSLDPDDPTSGVYDGIAAQQRQ